MVSCRFHKEGVTPVYVHRFLLEELKRKSFVRASFLKDVPSILLLIYISS